MLVDHQISEAIAKGKLEIDPYDPQRLQPASYDLTLDRYFRTYDDHKRHVIDPMSDERRTILHEMDIDQPFRLSSRSFALASTFERVALPANMIGRIEGKSSLARMGIFIHVTAGFIDPGFTGFVTLELFNAAPFPILLYPFMPICQIGFDYSAIGPGHNSHTFVVAPNAKNPYSGKYVNQEKGPQESLYYKNFDGIR